MYEETYQGILYVGGLQEGSKVSIKHRTGSHTGQGSSTIEQTQLNPLCVCVFVTPGVVVVQRSWLVGDRGGRSDTTKETTDQRESCPEAED